jgi:hypothetical protein
VDDALGSIADCDISENKQIGVAPWQHRPRRVRDGFGDALEEFVVEPRYRLKLSGFEVR